MTFRFERHRHGSAEHVIAHGLYKKSRGKNPSLPFMGIKNPSKALSEAKKVLRLLDGYDGTKILRLFHPETRPGELYIGSFSPATILQIRWDSIRLGDEAYEFEGTPLHYDWLTYYFPVFAQESEIESLWYGSAETGRLRRRFKTGDEVTWTLEGGTWNDYLREDFGIGPFTVASIARNMFGDPLVILQDSNGRKLKSGRNKSGAFPECYLRHSTDYVNMLEPRHTTIGRDILLT